MTAVHSTVFLPADSIEVACRGCSAVLSVPCNHEGIVLCRACRKSQQDSDAVGVCQAVRALAAGESPFDLLTPDERRVHLSQLAVAVTYARLQLAKGDVEAASILAAPVPNAAKVFEHYLSTAADAPSPEEQAAIYAMEENIAREEAVANDWR